MKFFKNRTAVIGAAGALVAGSLATGALFAPAQAVDSSYSCMGLTGPLDPIPVSAVSPLPATMVSGSQVGAQAFTMTANVPATILGLVDALDGVAGNLANLGATVAGASLSLVPSGGGTAIPVDITGFAAPSTPVTLGSPLSLPVAGQTAPFTAPAPGTYDVKLPAGTLAPMAPAFGFVPLVNGAAVPGLPASGLPCAGPGTTIGTVTVTPGTTTEKEASTTAVKLKNAPITTAKRAKLGVTVKQADGDPATGKVLAKEGTKVLVAATSLNSDGTKTLTLPKLKRGKHTVKVVYKGNETTKGSSKSITFTVRRG